MKCFVQQALSMWKRAISPAPSGFGSGENPRPELREKLRGEVMAADFQTLAPHVARGALILVAAQLDLLDVAEAFALDRVSEVEVWLRDRHVFRISDPELEHFAQAPQWRFQFVIVQPWVVAQALTPQGHAS
jgi:hypothetical protein